MPGGHFAEHMNIDTTRSIVMELCAVANCPEGLLGPPVEYWSMSVGIAAGICLLSPSTLMMTECWLHLGGINRVRCIPFFRVGTRRATSRSATI